MAGSKEIIKQFLDILQKDIIDRHIAIGQIASGETASRLHNEAFEGRGVMFGPLYISSLVTGRGATRGGGSGTETLQQRIYNWLRFKKYGISYQDDKERTSISWAISKVIHKRGTLLHRENRDTRLIRDILTQSRLQAFAKVFGNLERTSLTSQLVKGFST